MTPSPPCVDSKRPRVYGHHAHMLKHMYAWCRHTRRRFECTHGCVFESTHGFFHIFQRAATHKHTQTHTTTTNNTTQHNTQHHTETETERDRERQRKKTEKERQDKRREEKTREDERGRERENERENREMEMKEKIFFKKKKKTKFLNPQNRQMN